jgi:indole-3-glycerol phosphate synthase
MQLAHRLGLEVLLEMHSEEELEYAELEPDVCGINNRHLGSFVTDVETSFRLAELLPKDAMKVSESGISSPQIVSELREAGYRSFLIGEAFMKTNNPGTALSEFISQIRK